MRYSNNEKRLILFTAIILLLCFSIFTIARSIAEMFGITDKSLYLPFALTNIFWDIWLASWLCMLILMYLNIRGTYVGIKRKLSNTFHYISFTAIVLYIVLYCPLIHFFFNAFLGVYVFLNFLGAVLLIILIFSIGEKRLNLNLKKIIYFILLILLTLFTYSYFYKKYAPQNNISEMHMLASELNAQLASDNIDAQFNQKTPRNLFVSFYLRTLYMWSGYYRTYYKVINCVTSQEIKVNSIFDDELNNRAKMLIISLFDTNFRFDSIPSSVHGNKLDITLGSDWNMQTFSIGKKDNGDWYFTDSNFSDPKILEKYQDFKEKNRVGEKGKVKDLSIPVLAFTNFILGSQNIFGFDINDALSVLELKWIPEIVRNDYGKFLAFAMYKVLENEKITISSLPGRTSLYNDVIVLYVSGSADRSIYLKKVYEKGNFKWCFTKDVMNNALEIYEKEKMSYSETDPLWFKRDHFLLNRFPVLHFKIVGIPLYYIVINAIGILYLIFIYVIIIRLIKFIFDLFIHTKSDYFNPRQFAISTALLVSVVSTIYFLKGFMIYKLDAFIWYSYLYKITFGVLMTWWLCAVVNIICSYLTFRLRKEEEENFRISFVIEISKRLLNILIVVIFIGFLLQELGVNMINFLTALGLGGLAIAFACKDTIENLFGSIMIAIEKPFKLGDFIIIGDIEGFVEHIGLRSTRIRTFTTSYMTVPNVKFITSSVDNMGVRVFRRFTTTLDIVYSTKPELLKAFVTGIEEIVKNTNHIKQTDYHIKVSDLGDWAIFVLIYIYFIANSWEEELAHREDFLLNVLTLADKLGVEFAFPTQSLFLEKDNEQV